MFTASKWRKGKEETQTGAELLLWLAMKWKRKKFLQQKVHCYLFSKEDHKAGSKPGDNSLCRREFTNICLSRPETGSRFYLMSCWVWSLPTLTILWVCENGSRNEGRENALNWLRKDTSTYPPVLSWFSIIFILWFFFRTLSGQYKSTWNIFPLARRNRRIWWQHYQEKKSTAQWH